MNRFGVQEILDNKSEAVTQIERQIEQCQERVDSHKKLYNMMVQGQEILFTTVGQVDESRDHFAEDTAEEN